MVREEAVTRALSASSVFAALDVDTLRELARASTVRRYGAGEVVFSRGDRGGGMYVVARGSVALVVNAANGNDVVLDVLVPPRSFGEMAVVDDGARIATALVREPSVLVCLPRAAVLRLLQQHAAVATALLSSLARLVRHVDERATDLVLLDLRGRVAKYLAGVAAVAPAAADRPESVRVSVDVRMSQSELARLVGGSRQQVNRILGELATSGAIERRGARIVGIRVDLLRPWIERG